MELETRASKGHVQRKKQAAATPAAATAGASVTGGLPYVQRKGGGDAAGVHEAAAAGLSGSPGALPYLGQIQRSFGAHDVTGVRSHTGGAAAQANQAMGAVAYASGENVAFKSAPDLHTAAHEAAHVAQQRGGVHLKDGVGTVGDSYEQHADRVADAVVQGKSAEGLLSQVASPSAGRSLGGPVQRLGDPLSATTRTNAPAPAEGETPGQQRKYSPDQYIAMWEKERGRTMTDAERKTLARGCIGIVALNTESTNPPLDHAFATFDKAEELQKTWNQYIKDNAGKDYGGGKLGDYHAYVFGKLFWSNQNPDREARKKPDEKAFRPDEKGRVDMDGYAYRDQPGYVNFDYAFWDEQTQSFWHANHCEPGMIVYQSTKEKFTKGYIDFDRVVFCVAIARAFNPKAAARNGA
jgi:hypothetical protein